MIKFSPSAVHELIFKDMLNKRNLNIDQICGLLMLSQSQLNEIFSSTTNYFPPQIAGILADAFGYNRHFLLGGTGEMMLDLTEEDEAWKALKEDRIERLFSYLHRMAYAWNHPKAIEIFKLYDRIQHSCSKTDVMLLSQKIEQLFSELLQERNEREGLQNDGFDFVNPKD